MVWKPWEYAAWAVVLVVCLLVGLGIGQLLAPEPLIGVTRFEATIDTLTAADLIDLVEAARLDDRIAAVVIEVTSPGGLATSSESIYHSLLQLRAQKPVVVVIDGIAVSGGYYMAVAANRIYAPSSSYVGNVGTRGPRPDDPVLAPEELSSGPYKLAGGSRFDRIHQLDLVKKAFVDSVVHQRQNAADNPLTIDAATVGEARIYLGSEAVALGMIDFEGGRTDAILGAAELADLRRYRVVDLRDFLGVDTGLPSISYKSDAKALVETAPPDAVFLLDSRIPLPGLDESSALTRHMLRLREIAPATLESAERFEMEAGTTRSRDAGGDAADETDGPLAPTIRPVLPSMGEGS